MRARLTTEAVPNGRHPRGRVYGAFHHAPAYSQALAGPGQSSSRSLGAAPSIRLRRVLGVLSRLHRCVGGLTKACWADFEQFQLTGRPAFECPTPRGMAVPPRADVSGCTKTRSGTIARLARLFLRRITDSPLLGLKQASEPIFSLNMQCWLDSCLLTHFHLDCAH